MRALNNLHITAIVAMAVMFLGSCLTGCVTPRHIDELRADVGEVKQQNTETQEMVTHMDSVMTQDAEANRKMRTDVSMSVADLQQQINALLENYNTLMQQLQRLYEKQPVVVLPPKSSPGAQSDTPKQQGPASTEPAVVDNPPIDCGATYDDAFLLTRSQEYEKAIEKFREFLTYCSKHESAERAHYWIGECYYSLEKYVDAINEFRYLLDNYKSSVNASQALYKIARSNQELGKTAEAKKLYQQVIDDYPSSFDAGQAKERLRELK